MKKYISISQYPGKTGQYFYTKFFEYYNIDAVYEPYGTNNFNKSIEQAVLDNVSGISVSMPYKKEVLKYLDKMTSYCELYKICNTVVINDGKLVGYNCDIAGVDHVLKNIQFEDMITILGNGAMADMFIKNLEHTHYGNLNICARNLNSWENRNKPTDVVINCTGLGTSTRFSPFDTLPEGIRLVVDLAIPDNQLKEQCIESGVKYINGKEFYKQQFIKQFEVYTGIVPDSALFDKFEKQLYETI